MSSLPTLPDDDDKAKHVIVQYLKSQGIFDAMRRECLAEIDQKREFSGLQQKIEGYVSRFLAHQEWNPSLNKNQLRERLRRNLNESEMMKYGVEHLVDSAVQSKRHSMYPQIQSVVQQFLGMEDEQEKTKVKKEKASSVAAIENEKDMDTAQQDMEVDEDETTGGMIEVPGEDYSDQKQAEVQQVIKKESKEDTQLSQDNSIPSDMDTDDSNEAPSTSLILEVQQESSQPETVATSVASAEVKNEAPPPPPQVPPPPPPPPPPPKEEPPPPPPPSESKEVKQPPKLTPLPSSSGTKQPTPTEPALPLEEILSDVSSVHTSDLSDFDDRISLSSGDEAELSKRKISLEEAKQMATKTKEQKVDEKQSKTKKTQQRKKKEQQKTSLKEPRETPSASLITSSSRRGRERRVNPKYASADYSSIYSKGGSFSPSDEDIESDEDFQDLLGSPEVTRSPVVPTSPLESSTENLSSTKMKKEPKEEVIAKKEPAAPRPPPLLHPAPTPGSSRKISSSEPPKIRDLKKETTSNEPPQLPSIHPPAQTTARTDVVIKQDPPTLQHQLSGGDDESAHSSSSESLSVFKSLKRKVQRDRGRSERYDASDLYKPRPVIGASSSRRRGGRDNENN